MRHAPSVAALAGALGVRTTRLERLALRVAGVAARAVACADRWVLGRVEARMRPELEAAMIRTGEGAGVGG